MSFDLSVELSTTVLVILILLEIIWLACLIWHLREKSHPEKVVWTVVLCCLNILGLVLYVLVRQDKEDDLSDEQLKERFNRGE